MQSTLRFNRFAYISAYMLYIGRDNKRSSGRTQAGDFFLVLFFFLILITSPRVLIVKQQFLILCMDFLDLVIQLGS